MNYYNHLIEIKQSCNASYQSKIAINVLANLSRKTAELPIFYFQSKKGKKFDMREKFREKFLVYINFLLFIWILFCFIN